MSVQMNNRVEREVAGRPVVPRWAREGRDATIDRFLASIDHLPADVEKTYRMLSGPPESGTVRSLEHDRDAVCAVFFNPAGLSNFLKDLNPRVVALWKRGVIT